jgi:hypothetical protein
MQVERQAGLTVFTGTAAEIMEVLRGPRPAPQHDQHCKGYQWELYLQSAKRASAAVNAEARRMIAEINARREAREAQIQQLAAE